MAFSGLGRGIGPCDFLDYVFLLGAPAQAALRTASVALAAVHERAPFAIRDDGVSALAHSPPGLRRDVRCRRGGRL